MSSEQPLKSVYRSANISLRKADLARQNADDDEELYHLNQFAKTQLIVSHIRHSTTCRHNNITSRVTNCFTQSNIDFSLELHFEI